jgi:hypothetical protein
METISSANCTKGERQFFPHTHIRTFFFDPFAKYCKREVLYIKKFYLNSNPCESKVQKFKDFLSLNVQYCYFFFYAVDKQKALLLFVFSVTYRREN